LIAGRAGAASPVAVAALVAFAACRRPAAKGARSADAGVRTTASRPLFPRCLSIARRLIG